MFALKPSDFQGKVNHRCQSSCQVPPPSWLFDLFFSLSAPVRGSLILMLRKCSEALEEMVEYKFARIQFSQKILHPKGIGVCYAKQGVFTMTLLGVFGYKMTYLIF